MRQQLWFVSGCWSAWQKWHVTANVGSLQMFWVSRVQSNLSVWPPLISNQLSKHQNFFQSKPYSLEALLSDCNHVGLMVLQFSIVLTSCKQPLDSWPYLFDRWVYYTTHDQSMSRTFSENMELYISQLRNCMQLLFLLGSPLEREPLWTYTRKQPLTLHILVVTTGTSTV